MTSTDASMAFPTAFSSLAWPTASLNDLITLSRASGFNGIELRHLNGTIDLTEADDLQPARRRSARQRIEDAGLSVPAIDSSARFDSVDPATRLRQLEHVRAYAELAAQLNAPLMRVFGGLNVAATDDRDTRERLLDSVALGLTEAAAIAQQFGVEAILETHDSFGTSASLRELIAHGLSESYGILWDTLHTWRNGEEPEDTWRAFGDNIRHVHLKDSAHYDAESFDLVLTGEGSVPIPRFLSVLHERHYGGFVSFEWEKAWHPEITDASVAVPHFVRYLRSIEG